MKILVASLILLCLSLPVLPQTSISIQRDEVKKLAFMVGQWKGAGWLEYAPGQRSAFVITETIQSKLDGLALLIEGVGKRKIDGKGEGDTIHQALAVLSYDDKARRYRFLTHTAEGRYADADVKLIEGGWQWGLQFPGGMAIRYTIKIAGKDEWHEIGERTTDGKTWQQFHEMTLERQK